MEMKFVKQFWIILLFLIIKNRNKMLINAFILFISDVFIAILQGKVELYKLGFHQARKELKRLKFERKQMKEEIKHLNYIVELHEDIFSHFDFN